METSSRVSSSCSEDDDEKILSCRVRISVQKCPPVSGPSSVSSCCSRRPSSRRPRAVPASITTGPTVAAGRGDLGVVGSAVRDRAASSTFGRLWAAAEAKRGSSSGILVRSRRSAALSLVSRAELW